MIHVHTLGKAEIDAGEARVMPNSVRKFALLLYLAAERGRKASRATLRELVFPDQNEKNGLHSLRELVYQCRQFGARIISDPAGVELAADGVALDYVDVASGERFELADLKKIEGGFLPGYSPEQSEALAEWLSGLRARVTLDLSKALAREIRRAKGVGDWTLTEAAARACLALDGLNEEATLALAEMMAIGGAKAQAIKLLDEYVEEAGGASGPDALAARELKRRIRQQPPETAPVPASSPFVGRQTEMAILRAALKRAIAGDAGCLLLTGAAGIGKSRLAREFLAVSSLQSVQVAAIAAYPGDHRRPFGMFADVAPRLLAMRGSLGCSPESLGWIERLTAGMSQADPASPPAADIAHRISSALIDLLDAIAEEEPLILAVEDIQWLDEMSLHVLKALSRPTRCRRLILMTCRTGEVAGPTNDGMRAEFLELSRLDRPSAKTLLVAICDGHHFALDAELGSWLLDASNGNPFYLESLAGHYVATGERFSISPTIAALLSRRLECLTPEGSSVLAISALLGQHATADLIIEAAELPRFELLRAIGELESAQLVRISGTNIQPAHSLICDVAIGNLKPAQRRLAHQCAAEALEARMDKDHSMALAWACAEHWIEAANAPRGLTAVRRCATRACELGRPTEAAKLLNAALSFELAPSIRAEVAKEMVLAADAGGEPGLVFRGLALLRDTDPAKRHADLDVAEFRAVSRAALPTDGKELHLLECITGLGATAEHRVAAAIAILKYADANGRADLADRVLASVNSQALREVGAHYRLEYELLERALAADWEGVADKSRELLAEAGDEQTHTAVQLQMNAAIGFERAGLYAEAIHAAKLCIRNAEVISAYRMGLAASSFLSEVLIDLHRDEEAIDWLRLAQKNAEKYPRSADEWVLKVSRASCSLALGRVDETRAVIMDIRSTAVDGGNGGRERWLRAFSWSATSLTDR